VVLEGDNGFWDFYLVRPRPNDLFTWRIDWGVVFQQAGRQPGVYPYHGQSEKSDCERSAWVSLGEEKEGQEYREFKTLISGTEVVTRFNQEALNLLEIHVKSEETVQDLTYRLTVGLPFLVDLRVLINKAQARKKSRTNLWRLEVGETDRRSAASMLDTHFQWMKYVYTMQKTATYR
jgi:hypothetical protein